MTEDKYLDQPQPSTRSWYIEHLLPVVLAVMLGAALFGAYQQATSNTAAQQKIKQLEADVRTATGKYLDLQEKQQDEIEAAVGEKSVELWKVQQELEACKKGK